MTATCFCKHLNDDLLQKNVHLNGGEVTPPGFPRQVSWETAHRWLYELGFTPKQREKGCILTDM